MRSSLDLTQPSTNENRKRRRRRRRRNKQQSDDDDDDDEDDDVDDCDERMAKGAVVNASHSLPRKGRGRVGYVTHTCTVENACQNSLGSLSVTPVSDFCLIEEITTFNFIFKSPSTEKDSQLLVRLLMYHNKRLT